MYFKGFVDGYLVHIEKWYDGTIYCNVRYFKPGQSIHKQPVFDKTVYINDNEKGRHIIKNFKSSLVNYIATLKIKKDNKILITF